MVYGIGTGNSVELHIPGSCFRAFSVFSLDLDLDLDLGLGLGLGLGLDFGVHSKSRVRQPGGLPDPCGSTTVDNSVDSSVDDEGSRSDSVGFESSFDSVGDHVNVLGKSLLDEGVDPSED